MVTKGSPWMFRVTFTDDIQGKFLAYYTRQVFKYKNVVIIHDTDAYGSGLKDSFVTEASKLTLNITKVYSFDNTNSDYSFIDKELKLIKADIIMCTDTSVIRGRPYCLTSKGTAFQERLRTEDYFTKDNNQPYPLDVTNPSSLT